MPHLLRHWASVYNGHLRGLVTLVPFGERLAVELLLFVFTTQACRGWDSKKFRLGGQRSNKLRHRRGQVHLVVDIQCSSLNPYPFIL